MSHYKEGSFIQEVVDDLRFQQKMKAITATNHNCYKCSKSNPELIVLEGDDIPFDEKDKIHKVRDIKIRCTALQSDEKFRRACTSGNSSFFNRRCSKCAHAGETITGSYTKGTGSNKVTVKQTLIHCKLSKSKTTFCYPYFWCDLFKLKKEE